MLGWLADLFRLAWGLIYWNVRKAWYQARKGRSPCPCQSPSDSGRALETRCEACLDWHRARRFKRVCPLLVETPDGLRCSVDAQEVRPFWGRALAWYGGTAGAVYLAGVVVVFAFFRTIGYPVKFHHVALPPLWDRLTAARGWYFFEQSKRSFASGNASEGLLYLANAYEFDPSNYQIGLTLAKNYQVGQPAHSDRVFQQLLRDHPDRRHSTAQEWYRALLSRGSFDQIVALAQTEIAGDPARAHGWIRALLFAARQMGDLQPLRDLLADENPSVTPWRSLLAAELALRTGRTAEARAALVRGWPPSSPRRPAVDQYSVVYRVDALVELRDPFAALDLLDRHLGAIDDEARRTLRLDALAVAGATQMLQREVESLLGPTLVFPRDLPRLKILCAQLIRHPDRATFDRLCARLEREPLPFNSDTAGIWFSLLCTAGVVGDLDRVHAFTDKLKRASANPFLALSAVEEFFRGRSAARRITSILPILPLPIEVTYALIEHYEPAAAAPGRGPKKAG